MTACSVLPDLGLAISRQQMSLRGVAYLKFNVCNCGDVVNAFMKKRAFSNSVDPDETSHNASSHQVYPICHVKQIFDNRVDNIKSYMNQDLFHFVEQIMPSYIMHQSFLSTAPPPAPRG